MRFAVEMEGSYAQHPTGYVCQVCDDIAVVDMDDGGCLCAVHAIEVIMRIDLRASRSACHRSSVARQHVDGCRTLWEVPGVVQPPRPTAVALNVVR
jgi:hypothetical protein